MTEALNAIGKLIAEQGIGTAMFIISVIFFYYKIWPQYVAHQLEQRKLTDEYRQSTLNEIKELKEDSRKDKQLMYDAFLKNVEANVRLSTTMEQFTDELARVQLELSSVKRDVRTVYLIIGKDKRLIESESGETNV